MRTLRYTLFALLIVAAMLLVACGGTTEPTPAPAAPAEQPVTEQPAAETPTEAPAAASGSMTDLVLMGWSSSPAENERLQQIVDQYNAENPSTNWILSQVPDYDTKLQVSLAGGSPPDAFYVDAFKFFDFQGAGALDNGNDKIENPDGFVPNLREAFVAEGQFYCPPKDFSTLALEYNTAMFDAAGLEYPTADWSWQDLEDAASKLTDKDNGVYGMVITPDMARWLAFLYQAGGTVYNDTATEMTINSPEALAAMNFYAGLIQKGYAAQPSDVSTGWPGEAFGQGKAAMVIEGNWIMSYLKDQFPDLAFGVSQLPKGPAQQATLSFTVCYAAPASGKHLDDSWKFINYLTGDKGMAAWTGLGLAMPTRTALQGPWSEKYPEQQPFIDGASYSYPWQFVSGFQAVLDTMNSGLQQVFAGLATSEQVLAEAEQVGNEVLSR
ncbi:MAG: ABC transporter substrate-binding protein [Caldilineae bacterium]|nr:ABC transporter substrate-binding protein [Anaerolineae bacterium]MCB0199938.1 ABC transporter substrate-binding protein [Anaerolineae bacterium]MCB0203852.1 ABC transporter substrate-binding protein [Anaerolineae bacterium]MCB0253527.1 ABC transporter substrate-binding protein [Anaerolineae bacterium]MCB9152903.1 ABC transporter substrate-binding protein [Caldilineae bacterium]